MISEPNLPTDNRNKALRDKSGVKQSIRIMIIKLGENSLYDKVAPNVGLGVVIGLLTYQVVLKSLFVL